MLQQHMPYLGPGKREMMGGIPSWPHSTCPLLLDTHARSFGSRSRGPWVWNANKLPGKHPSVKSILAFLSLIFVLCALHFFSYSRSTAKSRAGEEPLKPDLQLTGMISQNHSHCLKILNAGSFCLALSSTRSVPSSSIHSSRGASALSLLPLLFQKAPFLWESHSRYPPSAQGQPHSK